MNWSRALRSDESRSTKNPRDVRFYFCSFNMSFFHFNMLLLSFNIGFRFLYMRRLNIYSNIVSSKEWILLIFWVECLI